MRDLIVRSQLLPPPGTTGGAKAVTGLSWDERAPYEVTIQTTAGALAVKTQVSRDLLVKGCERRTGHGVVVVQPREKWTVVTIGDNRGKSRIALPLKPLRRWLLDTLRVVPAGREFEGIDWDRLLHPSDET